MHVNLNIGEQDKQYIQKMYNFTSILYVSPTFWELHD